MKSHAPAGTDGSDQAVRVTLYSRPGCHLCDVMKALLDRASQQISITLQEIDISADAELDRRYGADVPLLMIDGRRVAVHRIGEAELRSALRAARRRR